MSLGTTLFCGLFVLIGIVTLVGGVVKPVNGYANAFMLGIMCVSGVIFGVAASGLFYVMNRPIVFDKNTRYFWKGRRSPRLDLMGKQSKGFVRLHDIHAIQLVSEWCAIGNCNNQSGYYS